MLGLSSLLVGTPQLLRLDEAAEEVAKTRRRLSTAVESPSHLQGFFHIGVSINSRPCFVEDRSMFGICFGATYLCMETPINGDLEPRQGSLQLWVP